MMNIIHQANLNEINFILNQKISKKNLKNIPKTPQKPLKNKTPTKFHQDPIDPTKFHTQNSKNIKHMCRHHVSPL